MQGWRRGCGRRILAEARDPHQDQGHIRRGTWGGKRRPANAGVFDDMAGLTEKSSRPRVRWNQEIEAYCIKRVGELPGIGIKELAKELQERFGYTASKNGLGKNLVDALKLFPDIEKARKEAIEVKRHALRGPHEGSLAQRARLLINKALAKGGDLGAVAQRAGLNESERKVIESYVLSVERITLAEIALKMGISGSRIQQIVWKAEEKIARAYSLKLHRPEGRKRGAKEGHAVKRIKAMISGRLEKGETLKEIAENVKLNINEKKALKAYVLPKKRITLDEVAARMGVAKVTVVAAVHEIIAKLGGHKSYRDILKDKYLKMSDEELVERIRGYGVTSRSQLGGKNHGLYLAAREKGILDRLWPSAFIEKAKKALETALQSRSMEDIKAILRPGEKAVLEQMVLAERPARLTDIARQNGKQTKSYHSFQRSLLKKLEGNLKVGKELAELKVLVRNMDEERLRELRAVLKPAQTAILERRILKDEPDGTGAIGKDVSLTRQRVWQIEIKMLSRIKRWKDSGWKVGLEKREGKRTKRLIALQSAVRNSIEGGRTLDVIASAAGLDENERAFVEEYLLSQNRSTMKEIAERKGKSVAFFWNSFAKLERMFALPRQKTSRGPSAERHRSMPERHRCLEGSAVKRIKALVADKLEGGETVEGVATDAGLSESEKRLLLEYVLPDERISIAEMANRLGLRATSIGNHMGRLDRKLRGIWIPRYKKGPWEGPAVKRIKVLVAKKLEGGETLEGIQAQAGLDAADKRILIEYVLPEERITSSEMAKRLGISFFSLAMTIGHIEKKLGGIGVVKGRGKGPREGRAAKRIKALVADFGVHETTGIITEQAGLTPAEREVLYDYILSTQLISGEAFAEKHDIKLSQLQNRIRNIELKLLRALWNSRRP